MGYSMGGATASAYARANPDRVSRLILLAPAGLGLDLGRFSGFVAKTPLIGDWGMEVLGARLLRRSYGEGNGTNLTTDSIATRALQELSVAGTLRAILSSQRGILSVDQRPYTRGFHSLACRSSLSGAHRIPSFRLTVATSLPG